MGVTYVVASLRLPQTNVLRCKANDVSCFVDDTSSCTSSTNVDANVVILFWVDLVPDIVGAFSVRVVVASGGSPVYRRHVRGQEQICRAGRQSLNTK